MTANMKRDGSDRYTIEYRIVGDLTWTVVGYPKDLASDKTLWRSKFIQARKDKTKFRKQYRIVRTRIEILAEDIHEPEEVAI